MYKSVVIIILNVIIEQTKFLKNIISLFQHYDTVYLHLKCK